MRHFREIVIDCSGGEEGENRPMVDVWQRHHVQWRREEEEEVVNESNGKRASTEGNSSTNMIQQASTFSLDDPGSSLL